MISLIKSRRNQFLVVVVITFLIYVNTLQNGFVLDDNDFIAGWQEIRSLQNTSRFFEGVIPSGHEGIYRPLKTLYLALSYKLWGLNPLGYHLQALLVHLISTGLVYLIAFQLTRKGSLAFLTSLLFGTHPIHTEAISFITASSDTLGIMFFFLSFYLYLLWESKKDGRMWCIIFSVISALVAFFTYEITITLPLMILFYDVCFKKLQKKGLSTKLKVYSVYFAGVISYLFVRIIILGIVARGNYLGNSFYLTMLVMTKVILKYIQVLILPINLNVKHLISEGIWSYKLEVADKTVLNQSIIDPVVLAAVAVMVVLVLIAIRSFRTHPMLTFSIGWFFLGLAPALNIIPSYMLMAERYLYLSSFGFCLLFAVLIHDFYTNGYGPKSYKKIAVTLIFIFVIASFCALTISRNREWKDDITINEKSVERAPENLAVHYNLGILYQQQGKLDLAVEEYKKALSIDPTAWGPHNRLGLTYHIQGKIDLAVGEYKQALRINPKLDVTHYNLGNIYRKQGSLDLAVEEYKKALKINPAFIEAHNNLGITYRDQGKIDLAIQEYEEALKIDPNFTTAIDNLNKITATEQYADIG